MCCPFFTPHAPFLPLLTRHEVASSPLPWTSRPATCGDFFEHPYHWQECILFGQYSAQLQRDFLLFSLNSQLSTLTLNSQPSTLNSQLSTLNSQISTLNSQLSTLNSQLSTLNVQLSTLNSQLLTLNSQLATLKLSTLNSQTFISQPSTPNSQLSTLIQLSTLNSQV